jgi:hydroxymethylpyrimidine/phosphomethylpyrimidine kinase
MPPPPVVLTIAGSDSSCGAGVQADLKAISALGGYALNALTSVVSETPGIVSQIRLFDAEFIADQIRVLFGRLSDCRCEDRDARRAATQVRAVAEAWKQFAHGRIPLVIDPVMMATSGGKLLEDEAVSHAHPRTAAARHAHHTQHGRSPRAVGTRSHHSR